MRKTKIICTIGPACDGEQTLRELCLAGMNVARLNFSHGNHGEHLARIEKIKAIREELGLPVAIMLDTKGPESRIGKFSGGRVRIPDGAQFAFTSEDVPGDETRVSVVDKSIIGKLNVGDDILVNDGLVKFVIEQKTEDALVCRCTVGGVLSDNKGMNFPNKILHSEYLSDRDRADLAFGAENGVDFVAASFVSQKSDVVALREYLDSVGGKDVDIIAKIENNSGVRNIDSICEVADGIMVARGDLGVEIPFEEVPAIQKRLIKKCRLLGKRVITATEMLESMIENPRPTRAEISDIANAVYDGSSALMLSGETAAGRHPVAALSTMAQVIGATERHIDYAARFHDDRYVIRNNADAVSHATCAMAIDTKAKGIVVSSLSGTTVRMVSRFRPPADIVGMTTSPGAWRKLALSWGVTPVLSEEFNSADVMFYHAFKSAKETLDLSPGDNVVLVGGATSGRSGETNIIRLEQVK